MWNKSNSSISHLFTQFELLYSADKSERFTTTFSSYSTVDTFGVFCLPFPQRTKFLLYAMHIIPSIVSAIIFKLDPRKACALDRIPVLVLTKYASVPSKLYNKFLAASWFSDCWKSFVVTILIILVKLLTLWIFNLLAFYLLATKYERPSSNLILLMISPSSVFFQTNYKSFAFLCQLMMY